MQKITRGGRQLAESFWVFKNVLFLGGKAATWDAWAHFGAGRCTTSPFFGLQLSRYSIVIAHAGKPVIQLIYYYRVFTTFNRMF